MASNNFPAPMAPDKEDVTDITLSLSNLPITAEVVGLDLVSDNPVVIPVNSFGTLRVTAVDPCGWRVLEVEVVSGKDKDRKLSSPADMSSSRLEPLKLDIGFDPAGLVLDQRSSSMAGEAPSRFNKVVLLGGEKLCAGKIGGASGSWLVSPLIELEGLSGEVRLSEGWFAAANVWLELILGLPPRLYSFKKEVDKAVLSLAFSVFRKSSQRPSGIPSFPEVWVGESL